jgi:hypothetical protein
VGVGKVHLGPLGDTEIELFCLGRFESLSCFFLLPFVTGATGLRGGP